MPVAKKASLSEICAPIEEDLKLFNEELRRELASNDGLIQSMHDHILKMTGKFLRPILTLLSSKLDGHPSSDAVRLAVAVELIHTATLVHDDIIDGSEWRRNQPSVHAKWGRELSIVSGDYLYAKAFMILAGFQDVRVNQAFATCAHIMCEGEMKQIEKRKDFDLAEEEYLRIIHKKTAALFQASCAGGVFLSTKDMVLAERLGRYGYALGMAFQIVDDCMDLAGDTLEMGKKAGLDLAKSDMTLPLLYVLASLNDAQKDQLEHSFQSDAPEEVLRSVKTLASECCAVERSMEKAKAFAEEARACLADVSPSRYRDSLDRLVDYCLERTR